MSRRPTAAGQLLLIAALLAVTAYVLIASVQNTDHPAVGAGQLGADIALAFAGFLLLLALYVATWLGLPRLLRWRRRRAVRRVVRQMAQDRARRMQRRHAARLGGAR